ncbi:MAG: hypothetical protein M0R21_05400 [Lentimicrobiaceae bacterium]|nr:hypothetical protein [Lentimicrobiaceae bacterium]
MKEKDIKVDFDPHKVIMYAEKEDNTYGQVLTGSYISKNYLDDFQQKQLHREEELLQQLQKGEISPVYYYMEIEGLTMAELASRAGISKRKARKHLNARKFGKTTVKDLLRYAEIFNIPLANFFQIIQTENDSRWKAHFKEDKKILAIIQNKTSNPVIIETKIEEKE